MLAREVDHGVAGGRRVGRWRSHAPRRRPVRRRAAAAGIETVIGNHSFRATGITAYLENGGTLEHAQQIAEHESPRTTKLYDRTSDTITLDEIVRITPTATARSWPTSGPTYRFSPATRSKRAATRRRCCSRPAVRNGEITTTEICHKRLRATSESASHDVPI